MTSRRNFLKTVGLLGLAACTPQVRGSLPRPERVRGLPIPPAVLTPAPTERPLPAELPSVTPTATRCGNRRGGSTFLPAHEVRRGDCSRRVVLMTYDDFDNSAEGKANFDRILPAYSGLKCKATFFIPGGYLRGDTMLEMAPVLERIVSEGHVLGCHGLLHEPMTTYPDEKIRRSIDVWLDQIHAILPGFRPRWFRAPFGDVDGRLRSIFAEYGMQSVLWSVVSNGMVPETYAKVVDVVRPGDIVLSHSQRPYDAGLAEAILEGLLAEGFTVESVETGLAPEDYLPEDCGES
jgi:peptidoglycan/xylan/chitin deacetylase (PgdA/CDA1 family)